MNKYSKSFPAEERFLKNGYVYCLRMDGKVSCLYEIIKPIDERFGTSVGFEVHVKRIREERIINSKIIGKSLRRPSDEDFGKYAWSYYPDNKEGAKNKHFEIERQYKPFTKISDFEYDPTENTKK